MNDAAFWSKTRLTLRGTLYNVEVDAWQHTSNPELVVTPTIGPDGRVSLGEYGITHLASGVRLWPNSLPLDRAKALCLELLQAGNWQTAVPTDARFRERIETIARRYFVGAAGDGTSVPAHLH